MSVGFKKKDEQGLVLEMWPQSRILRVWEGRFKARTVGVAPQRQNRSVQVRHSRWLCRPLEIIPWPVNGETEGYSSPECCLHSKSDSLYWPEQF